MSLWDELLGNVALKPSFNDGLANGRVIEFLSVVDLVSARIAAGMIVAEILVALLDGSNDVAFHDLHVINIVEQFESL